MSNSLRPHGLHGILQARIHEWVAIPSSRGSSQPWDGTQVSHTAGKFFTIWALLPLHKGSPTLSLRAVKISSNINTPTQINLRNFAFSITKEGEISEYLTWVYWGNINKIFSQPRKSLHKGSGERKHYYQRSIIQNVMFFAGNTLRDCKNRKESHSFYSQADTAHHLHVL